MDIPLMGYTVVRYIPDLGRNEPHNVGIIMWIKNAFLVRFDGLAVVKLIRENPWLTLGKVASWETSLDSQLLEMKPVFSPSLMLDFISKQSPGIPISLAEACFIRMNDNPMETTMEGLLESLVRPEGP